MKSRELLEQQNKINLRRESIFNHAKKALHSEYPVSMPCRETELEKLKTYIIDHLNEKKSGSLYISGPPGTGKTAVLNLILNQDNICFQFRKVYINCNSIKYSGSIFSKIVKELEIKCDGKTEKDCIMAIEKYLQRKNHKMILMVLDEIDQLESRNQHILYTLFEWPARPSSRFILIGIANALDLTDRILPRLQAKCELKPELMHFTPYTKQQIIDIFTSRLKEADVLEVFSSTALQMLAGKVAAISGDVRRALDIGRRVIETIEYNKNNSILKSMENLTNEIIEQEKPQIVDLHQVVNALNNVYGTTQNITELSDDSLPLQQKIILCSLLLVLKKSKNKDITIGKLHDVYRRVCNKRNILAVDQGEFIGLCSLIESKGIIKIVGKKATKMNKVHLEWDENEVNNILKDKKLVHSILLDDDIVK